jgi:hypothetical protein
LEFVSSKSFEEGKEMLIEDFTISGRNNRGERVSENRIGISTEQDYKISLDKRLDEEIAASLSSSCVNTNVQSGTKSDYTVPFFPGHEADGRLNRFNIPPDFDHDPSPSNHYHQTDCKIIDKTYNTILCDDFDSDDRNRSTVQDNSLYSSLENKINNVSICDDCVLVNGKSSFKSSSGLMLSQGSKKFNLTSDFDYNNRTSKFCLNQGLKWSASRNINLVGKTECSIDANRHKFSVPTFENVDLKNRRKFDIPTYSAASSIEKKGKFSIPDYTKYKIGSRHSKFQLYKDMKTFKSKARHLIPATFSKGWGFTWFSIPKIQEGLRTTRAKMMVSKDFVCPHNKTNFQLSQPFSNDTLNVDGVDSFGFKDVTFTIPEPGKLLNRSKTISITQHPEGPFRSANVKDYTGDYDLINLSRDFKLSIDCTVDNVVIGHDFKDLEVECSQISV